MSEKVQVDYISASKGGLQGSGQVAMRLLQSGFNINALRTNDVLRKEEWLMFDNVVVTIARKRLVAVGEMLTRGLRFDIADGLGVTQLQWEQEDEMTEANVTMSGLAEAERDRLTWSLKTMPLPIIHKDFQINLRNLMSSRRSGTPLDTAHAMAAGRVVSEKIESVFFNGLSTSIGGTGVYGITTEPNVNTGTLSDWENVATTGAAKVADVIEIIAALNGDNMYGPFGLFVTQAAYTLLADDYKAESDKTQLQRLLEIPGIEFIKPSKDLATGTLAALQLTSDVVEEIVGLQPTVVMWETHGGMMVNFKVMAIMLPRVRSTKTLQSGVAIWST